MKKILAAVFSAIMIMGVSAYAKTIQVTIDSQDVYISDEYIKKDTLQAAAYIENDITMVPLRFITEKLGAEVQWNHDTKEVTITKGEEIITLQIGNINAITVSGGETVTSELLAPPVIVNDITLVPLRFVSENIGAAVEYIAPTRQVLITDDEPATIVGNTPVYKDLYRTYYLANYDYILFYGEEALAENSYNEVTGTVAFSSNWRMIDPDDSLSEESLATINSITDDEWAMRGILKGNLVKLLRENDIANRGFNMLTRALSDEDTAAIYNDSYVCAKHILLSTVDAETGESVSAVEKKKIKAEAEAVLKKAKGGADFDELVAQYGEDPGMINNPDGYVFTTGTMVEEFEQASFELEENEISGLVETSYGYHIIQKLPLPAITEEIKAEIGYNVAGEIVQQMMIETPVTNNMTAEEIIEYVLMSSVG